MAQYILVASDSLGVSHADEIDGATVALETGTDQETGFARFARGTGLRYAPVPAENDAEVAQLFRSGAADLALVRDDRMAALGLDEGTVILDGFSVGAPDPVPGDDTLDFRGSTEDLAIDALAGRDSVRTGSGDDTVKGGAGADQLWLGGGRDSGEGGAGKDKLYGQNGADTLLGGAKDDRLDGNQGNDRLFGGNGNDLLNGGNGRDRLLGQKGNDTLNGRAGNDTLDGGNGNDSLNGALGKDLLRGSAGQDALLGGNGNDTLEGGAGKDTLLGGNGNDKLEGDAGNDRLTGGTGNDSLMGGAGNDRLIGNNGADRLNGNNGNDTLSGGNGIDRVTGGKGKDLLQGNRADDTLVGGPGSDTLEGGAGNDRLTGGGSKDFFVIAQEPAKQFDTITDFKLGTDRLMLFTDDYTATVSDGDMILNLGDGQRVKLLGITNKKALARDIRVEDGPKEPVDPEVPGGFDPESPSVIYDLGGKFDQGFNQAASAGAQEWAETTGDTFVEFELISEAQREQAIRRVAEAGSDAVVLPSAFFASDLEELAPDYPDTTFVLVDGVVDQPNVRSVTFAIHEGAYLMGVAAAMASTSGTVGFVGGMDIPLTRAYGCAFAQGVMAVDPDAEVLVNMTGTTPLAYNDPVKGAELASAQIANGADVIFHAAGGTGLGVLQAAADAGVLGIGNDIDQNHLHPGSMLTSLVKDIDEVVFNAFTGGEGIAPGIVELGLAEGGMSYARDEGQLTPAMLRQLAEAEAAIASGSIEVHNYRSDSDCPLDLF